MSNWGKMIGVAALASALAACSASQDVYGIAEYDAENVGLATKAQAALIAGDYVRAVEYGERAVEVRPTDAGFRALLGNAYFASGRFASAESAYRDALALFPNQPQVQLKKALVQIAQGKESEALYGLETARGTLKASDLGLAVAMAGRPHLAVQILDDAARTPGADATTRQNLALALAMTGDWQRARAVAAQDVPANQLDSRMQEWMGLTRADAHPSQRVAALTGVYPAQADPGLPVRLALSQDDEQPRYAALDPEPASASVAAAVVPPPPAPMPDYEAEPAPQVLASTVEIPVRDVELLERSAEVAAAEDVELAEDLDVDAVAPVALAATMIEKVKQADVAPTAALSDDSVRLTESVKSIRTKAATAEKASRSVVQLGSYSQRDSLERAWTQATAKFAPLADYSPVAAKFDRDGKAFYRLAAHGFASDADARSFCDDAKKSGMSCFVRTMAGDKPTKFARRD